MELEIKKVKARFKEYSDCPYCDTVYHNSYFTENRFSCKDCGNTSAVPEELVVAKPRPKFKKNKKARGERHVRR